MAVTGLGLAELLPQPVRLLLEAACVGWLGLQLAGRHERAVWLLLLGIGAVLAAWAAQMVNSNIPSFEVGLLGWRKTCFALVGVGIGATLPPANRHRWERLLIGLLLVGLSVSLISHYLVPNIERSIMRAADVSTGQFGGRDRLQGIYAGPFHVALASAFLTTTAMSPERGRLVRVLSAAVGVVALLASNVRTGILATALVGLLAFLAVPRGGARLRRLSLLIAGGVAVLALGVGSVVAENPAVESLSSSTTDTRFRNRFDTWQQGFEMIRDRPVAGHGSGSAGDTLGPRFAPLGRHVTSHNVPLKLLVEGGLVAGGIAVAVWSAVLTSVTIRLRTQLLAASAALLLIIFGLTGAIIEAHPIAFYLAILVGIGWRGAHGGSPTRGLSPGPSGAGPFVAGRPIAARRSRGVPPQPDSPRSMGCTQ